MHLSGGDPINECYVTVPANYKDNQREAIKEAAKRVGLNVMSVVPEPTAAVMSWYFDHKDGIGVGEKILVFDFGGGTLDISIIEHEGKGKFQVLVTDGDPYLGGSDVDMEVANLVIKMVRDQEDDTFNPMKNKRRRVRFLADCEGAKTALANLDEVDFVFSVGDLENEYKITRHQLASIFSKTLQPRIDACLNRLLVGPGRARGVIKHVFLVGGSTRLVAVQEYLHSMFHCNFPNVNPDSCVAEGALTIARSQADPFFGGSVVEIIPFSYGLLCSNNQVVMLLNKGTRIPCESGRLPFGTNEDYVPYITSAIYQWNGQEMDQARAIKPKDECTYIKDYRFENPDPKPKDQQQFIIYFKLAVGGTLEVICCDANTGREMNHTTFRALVANGGN